MKKLFFAVIPAFVLASCSFWNEPVEDFFSYWSSEAYVTGFDVKAPHQSNREGIASVASGQDAAVILHINNPKHFGLRMPSAGSTDMMRFGAFDPQPILDTDYTLEQLSSTALKLTFTAQFLKKYEWGQKDLGASIMLTADDGRKFNKSYSFSFNANTRPPEIFVVLAQTTAATPQYVLCLQVPDMSVQVNGQKLHKDIAQIVINGTSYPLTLNSAGSDFVKPTDGSFISQTDVTQLTTPDAEALPAGSWILYYKTDVPVGGAYTEYAVTLKDEKGLTSEVLETGTTTNKPAEETVAITAGSHDSGSGTNADPFIIKPANASPEAQLTISCTTPATTVHCTITDVDGGVQQYTGNPLAVELGLNGANEKRYEVKYHTKGAGYNPTAVKTKYYTVLKLHTVTFNANGGTYADGTAEQTASVLHGRTITAPATPPEKDGFIFLGWYKETSGTSEWNFASDAVTNSTTLYAKWSNDAIFIKGSETGAWKKLKDAAAKASGPALIIIDGEVKAEAGSDGEIMLGRDLTIQGKNGGATNKLNVNSRNHRIFNVDFHKKLTLKNLTLTGGEKSGDFGGAIMLAIDSAAELLNSVIENCKADDGGALYAKRGASLTLTNTVIKNCEATVSSGGAIYAKGAAVNMTGCTLTGNEAKRGGALYAKDDGGTTATVTISGGVIGGTTTADANKASGTGANEGSGGAIYADDGCMLTLKDSAALTGNTATGSGGGVYFNGTTLSMRGGARITPSSGSDTNQKGKNDVYLFDGTTITLHDTLTAAAPVARITVADDKYLPATQVLDGSVVGAEYAKFIVTPKGNDVWGVTEQGKLALMETGIDGTASPADAWKKLKEAVASAGDGAVIRVKGEVKATNAAANSGEIVINKNLTIKKADDASTAVLNANKDGTDAPTAKHRIFKVEAGKTLTLQNLTLKGGKVEAYGEAGGGAIHAEGPLTLKNCTVTDNRIEYGNGGGICAESALTMEGCTVNSNTAADGESVGGGGIYAAGTLTMQDCTISGNYAKKDGGGIYAVGELSLTDCTVTANESQNTGTGSGSGGGIYIKGRGVMTGGSVTGNKANSNGKGGGIYIDGTGSFTMTGVTVSSNTTAYGDGGGIYIAENGSFAMTGGAVSNNTTAHGDGGGVCVRGSSARFMMKDAAYITPSSTADKNVPRKNDVYLYNDAKITLSAALTGTAPVARITVAHTQYKSTTQVLDGSAVSSEHGKFAVTPNGSDVWKVNKHGMLFLNTATVSGSASEKWKKLKEAVAAIGDGGTIIIDGMVQSTSAPGNSGEIIIDKDLTIQGKTGAASDILDANESAFSATENKHRIFHVKDGKTLTLKNLTLKNGAVGNGVVGSLGTTGGGIRIENGTVSLSDVIISSCKAITAGRYNAQGKYEGFHGNGAGIYVVSGTIIMENTTLSANDADAYGGAVYLKGGTLTMKGSSVVTPSTGGDANKTGKNDVRLVEGAKIIVDGALTGSVPVARITVAYNEYLPTRQVLDGTAVASHNAKFTVTDQELGTDNGGVHVRKWNIKSDGYLQSEEVTLDGSKTRAWQALKDAVRTASDGDVIAINGTIQATNLGTGEYVDNGEIVIDKNLTIKKADTAATAVLDANKDTGSKPKHRIFKVKSGNTLTLENLTLKGGIAEMSDMDGGGGVYVETSGKLIMTGSSITDCEAIGDTVHNNYGEGGGVNNKGTVEMTGGEIKNNKARNGGGVHNRGTLILTNATLTGNTATFIGGALCLSFGSSSEMTGGKIISNTCSGTSGGGVYIHAGTFKLNSSASIESNTASYGGGAYVNENGTLIINGGSIKLNKAQSRGGGVYVSGNSTKGGTVEISGGEIKSNTAQYGGGIYVKDAGATLTMSGGTISENKAVTDPSAPSGQQGGAGGGIFIGTGAKLTISGGTVGGSSDAEGNSAAVGGGIYLMKGSEKTKITGGSITYNKADSIGGGIYMMDNGAKAEMTGGSITNNKAGKSGGGVYISDYSSTPRSLFTLKGGKISYNTAKNGGGITAFGDFNMDGGIIEKNTATGDPDPSLNLGTGGGIDLVAATMNMTGGEIRKNHAKRGGGGVSIGLSGARDAVFNMSGGTISGNTLDSAGKGAGVEFFTESTEHGGIHYYTRMKMSGSAKVDTNNDVYLNNSRMITVDGTLTPAGGIAARLTPKTYGTTRLVLDGSKVGTEHIKFTVTRGGSPAKNWYVGSNGKLTDDPAAIFNTISEDKIKAFEDNLETSIVEQYNNLKGRLIFYKTNNGNYGVMLIANTPSIGTDVYNLKFKYKTYSKHDGTILKNGDTTVNGTYSFDLDTGTQSTSTAPLNDTKDFFLYGSTYIDPQNGAKFYVLP